jgi:hypothetical protein
MKGFDTPHADYTFIEMRPPRKILHVVTKLPRRSCSPGFSSVAWYEMMKAIVAIERGHEGRIWHEIHAGDDPDPLPPSAWGMGHGR